VSSRGSLTVEVRRTGEVFSKVMTPTIRIERSIFGKTIEVPLLGVVSSDMVTLEKLNLARAFLRSLRQTSRLTVENIVVFGRIVTGRGGLSDLGGPVRIARYSGMAMRGGLHMFIHFIALISVSLGFMNLLPIPALDGGHILICLLEIVRRKPLDEKLENSLTGICFSILILLIIFLTMRDILGIFNEK
jgi:regulator of sigma E protease